MYCVANATIGQTPDLGSFIGWPFQTEYGYFCDERDNGLFILSHGLVTMLSIIGLYLLIVLYIGPRLMRDRKPLEFKNIIRLYNFAIILVNLYIVNLTLTLTENGQTFFDCRAVTIHYHLIEEVASLSEVFMLSRLADFLDTFWFVLRKKQSQITFLHVFHHTYVPTLVYISTRLCPIALPYNVSFPFINSAVHIVMYIYYLLATFPQLRPYLWWKRYLTLLQLMQFVAILAYHVIGWFFFSRACGSFQTPALVISLVSAVIFLGLYNQFYRKKYNDDQTCSPSSSKCVTKDEPSLDEETKEIS